MTSGNWWDDVTVGEDVAVEKKTAPKSTKPKIVLPDSVYEKVDRIDPVDEDGKQVFTQITVPNIQAARNLSSHLRARLENPNNPHLKGRGLKTDYDRHQRDAAGKAIPKADGKPGYEPLDGAYDNNGAGITVRVRTTAAKQVGKNGAKIGAPKKAVGGVVDPAPVGAPNFLSDLSEELTPEEVAALGLM